MTTQPDVSNAAGILRLANAFCDAKAVLTAVELGLFGALDEGAATREEIRERLKLHGRGLGDYLNLLVVLGLLERENGRYRNAEGAQRHLVPGRDEYVGGFLMRSNYNLYPAYGRLSEALRSGEQQSGSDFTEVTRNPKILGQFLGMMDALTNVLGEQLVEAYDGWDEHASVLDVGGARGNLCAQIVAGRPHLRGKVFDLPEMEPFFGELMGNKNLTEKISFHGGDFFTDALPTADVVVLGHVLHDWNEEQRRQLVAAAYQAVSPGGDLLIYDRMLDEHLPHYTENLVISLDMLLVTDGGSEYPVEEIREHGATVGCTDVKVQPLGAYDTLAVLHKPS